jgi:hypothetical protein
LCVSSNRFAPPQVCGGTERTGSENPALSSLRSLVGCPCGLPPSARSSSLRSHALGSIVLKSNY